MLPASPFTPLRDRFSDIVRLLVTSLTGRRFLLPPPLVSATLQRLCCGLHRVTALVNRLRAGPLPVRAPRIGPTASPTASPALGPRARGFRLPSRRGWLLPLLPVNAAVAHAQLRDLLAQPDMTELIARAPALVRVLRPLCRMLAVDLPVSLQRPTKPRRPRKPRPKPPPPDRSLPSRRPSIVVRGTRLPRIVYGPG